MIILDTETTDLLAPEAAPLSQQPSIIEVAAIRVNPRTLEEIGRMQFLIHPRFLVTEKTTLITGITNDMLKDQPPFAARFNELVDFFGGQRTMVAHNMTFDRDCLFHEFRRLGKERAFPWPPKQICTVELTYHFHGYRLNLSKLYAELTGKERKDAHRAMPDVETLLECVGKLRERKLI